MAESQDDVRRILEAGVEVMVSDLRHRMKFILKALERDEELVVLYHGKPIGIIKTVPKSSPMWMTDRPFFGMRKSRKSVAAEMKNLRGGRYRDL